MTQARRRGTERQDESRPDPRPESTARPMPDPADRRSGRPAGRSSGQAAQADGLRDGLRRALKGGARSASTPTMSIGEVLAVLKPEFSDITVSKLRFLEGAGLVAPDRTAAGYRKFSQDDVDRLRFVLRAQRDQYLPLRVIRQRLLELERGGGLDAVRAAVRAPAGGHAAGPAGLRTLTSVQPALRAAASASAPAGAPPPGPPPATHFTREELCKAAGVDGAALTACESFGLISGRAGGYTQDDLLVLRLARELGGFGIEPRHLRMYKIFAEREAALFGQVVAPLLRQRNPEAHQRARDDVERLANQCGQLRDAFLRTILHAQDAQ